MARSPVLSIPVDAATRRRRPSPSPAPLPGVVRTHLEAMTGRFGIYQHARGEVADPGLGYCTDDVARAAIVDVLQARTLGRSAIASSLARSVHFLAEAVPPRTGRLRNFRDDDGNWLEREGSADAHARGVQALGIITGEPAEDSISHLAAEVLEEILPVSLELGDVRPWAHVILGCVAATSGRRPPASALIVLEELGGRLFQAFAQTEADWPWPEATVTYENAILAQALIEGGARLGYPAMVVRGLMTLDWLLDAQVAPAGHLELVGNRGWWTEGSEAARFDQQPIDAAAVVEACAAAWRTTGRRSWLDELERAYAWFWGANAIGVPVSDPIAGASADGLTAAGVNANQGAESTLAWLASAERVRIARLSARAPTRDQVHGHR